jgi:hypothetical protein
LRIAAGRLFGAFLAIGFHSCVVSSTAREPLRSVRVDNGGLLDSQPPSP